MIKIANLGNTHGGVPKLQNTKAHLDSAIESGYGVKAEVWIVNKTLMIGDGFPTEEVRLSYLQDPRIWVRAMTLETYVSLYSQKVHVFWNNQDDFTFTNQGIKWANKGVCTVDGIMYLPETSNIHMAQIANGSLQPLGVCSNDFYYLNKSAHGAI